MTRERTVEISPEIQDPRRAAMRDEMVRNLRDRDWMEIIGQKPGGA
jgi:hypothetical protein